MNSTRVNMPTIGIVGVTIPGAANCLQKINLKCREHFEQHQHPNVILHQLNFGPTHHAQTIGRWDIVEDRLMESVEALCRAGADFAVIPANTVHKVIDAVQSRSIIPIISMLDVVADACQELKLKKVGVMGTQWTMAGHLYSQPLKIKSIEEVIPTEEDQEIIQKAIFEELIPTGKASESVISTLLGVVERLKVKGCDGIALACTELPLVLNGLNCGIHTLDTTDILASAAVKRAVNIHQNKYTAKL